MSHAPSLSFPSHLSTTLFSTCTPVRPSIRPSTRPSHGDSPCADPSNVSFGHLAETHSPSGYEPKDLTEEDASILVKAMSFHTPSMSPYGAHESIATPRSDLDDEQTRNMLVSPLYLTGERSKCRPNTSLSLLQRNLSVKFISLPRKRRETFSLKKSRVKKHFPTKKAFPQDINSSRKRRNPIRFSDLEDAARLVLEEQRYHLLAEAKSEILKQEK